MIILGLAFLIHRQYKQTDQSKQNCPSWRFRSPSSVAVLLLHLVITVALYPSLSFRNCFFLLSYPFLLKLHFDGDDGYSGVRLGWRVNKAGFE